MSASPELQAESPVATPNADTVTTPITGDADDEDAGREKSAEPDAAEENEEAGGADLSDEDSILSEVDEAQFEDFDLEKVEVEDRPQLAIDEENLKLIGRHKRKRTEDEGRERRKKEGRREKKGRRLRDQEEESGEGASSRHRERKKRAESPQTDEETLDPETRMFLPGVWRCDLP
jgi:transcription factor SPN1